MPISEVKKASNARWDKENMATLGTKIRKDTAETFRRACKSAGTTPSKALAAAVAAYLGDGQALEPMQEPGMIALLPESAHAAQQAADAAGETIGDFLTRAITHQAQRDAVARRMKAQAQDMHGSQE